MTATIIVMALLATALGVAIASRVRAGARLDLAESHRVDGARANARAWEAHREAIDRLQACQKRLASTRSELSTTLLSKDRLLKEKAVDVHVHVQRVRVDQVFFSGLDDDGGPTLQAEARAASYFVPAKAYGVGGESTTGVPRDVVHQRLAERLAYLLMQDAQALEDLKESRS